MGKQYRTTLDLKEGEEKIIRALCLSYRGIYNKAIDIQFYYLSYSKDHTLVDEETIEKDIKEFQGVEDWYPKKLDNGIVEGALKKGIKSFRRWWKEKVQSHCSSTWTYPRHLSLAKAFHFYTSTHLNVSKGGFVYFPKVGRIKLEESHYVPEGYYKNVKVQFDGKKWRIQFEDLNDEIEKIDFLMESLEVSVDEDGIIYVGEIHFNNIIEGDTYTELSSRLSYLRDKLKEARAESQNDMCKKIANNIMYTKTKMKDVKAAYFRDVSKKILNGKPKNLIIRASYDSETLERLDSSYLRASSTEFFLNMLKKKAERMGIKVTFKGIDSSIFIREK